MRRFILVLLCCFMLATVVLGADQASSIQSTATVTADGDCQVTLIAAIHLEGGDRELRFPLPRDAKNVRVNNSAARTSRRDNRLEVDISKFVGAAAGDYTLTFTYTLDGVVKTEGELGQVLNLPLLCGFAYPVEKFQFTVTLPGNFTTSPTFSSGYYQESIESVINFRKSGATVTGSTAQRLQDHETLDMRLLVPQELFTQAVTSVFHVGPYWTALAIVSALALAYWILTMRAMPLRRIRCATPPEGLTAGEMGSRLVHCGAELTLMVMTWAQLGYVLVTMDESGRVFIHKRMEMGNERSSFENHYFRSLFRKQRTVDGTSYRYAQLCRKALKEVPGARSDYQSSSGNPMLFRWLCIAVGVIAGAAVGGGLTQTFVVRIFLTVLCATMGAGVSWLVHEGCKCLHLRNRMPLLAAGIGMGVWLVLSLFAGQWAITLVGMLVQLLGGLSNTYGGRRSELGRQTASEILGFRRYLKSVTKDELQRILKVNPDYYYEMAPYALALGVDKIFAARFERLHQPNCTYLLTGIETNRTAAEWNPQLRDAVDALNARQKRLRFEKLSH